MSSHHTGYAGNSLILVFHVEVMLGDMMSLADHVNCAYLEESSLLTCVVRAS